MSLDHRLIDLLVCPVCKGPLEMRRMPDERGELRPADLVCPADRLAFPIRDGIPVMLENEASPVAEPADTGPVTLR
jgi:uncharacterized protein YbaR (Trm112 family)